MTTPLFISESVSLEIRNILKALDIGAKVRFRGEDGEISFVSDQYITICTRKIPDPVHRYGYRAVNVLVYPHEWDDLEIDDSYFKNKKNYHGKTNDHPGNEMLPDIKDR